MTTTKLFRFLTTAAAAAMLALPASGTLLVYEPFDYEPALSPDDYPTSDYNTSQPASLHGKGNGVGMSGTWADAADTGTAMWLAEGSLAFGDLPTTGNHIRHQSNRLDDRYHRTLTADLADSAELWISFLANKLQSTGWGAEREGIAIANQVLSSSQLNVNAGGGLQGFGLGWDEGENGWRAYGWDGTDRIEGDDSFGVARNGTETNLLFGRIQFNAGADGKDIFTVYHYNRDFAEGTVTADMGNLVAFGSLEVDVDESLLGTLNVTRQVNTAYDEIRIGTSLASVIPEPSTTGLLAVFGVAALLRRRLRR